MQKKTTLNLSRQHWMAIGFKVLVNKGIDAVRVESLAKLLNVTRGSFYWHFKNRDDLIEAMLKEWESTNTDDIISKVEAIKRHPEEKLLSLFEIAAQDNDKWEKAIRIWAANDSKAAAMLARVDQRRLTYLWNLFLKLDFPDPEAKVRAQVAYSVRLGWLMSVQVDSTRRLTEIRFVHKILTKRNK